MQILALTKNNVMKTFYKPISLKALLISGVLAMPIIATSQLDSASYVSDSSWSQSTVITSSTLNGYWSGVAGVLPSAVSYSISAPVGQPYGFPSIHPINGSMVIKADSDISYFRKVIHVDTMHDISARIMTNVDDHIEVYINGQLLAGEYEAVTKANWKNPPFDAFFKEDETVTNAYMGAQAYDSLSSLDMDSLFVPGDNEVVVVCRNSSSATDKGGFSFRLDIKGKPGVAKIDFIASDGTRFKESTVVSASSFSGNWGGVNGILPPSSTFTITPSLGQPYSYHSIDAVNGADVINSGSNITFYRATFELTKKSLLNARFKMNVDDGMEIYVNGILIAREGSTGATNRRSPSHDLKLLQDGSKINGFMGGDVFDFVTDSSLADIFVLGLNEVVLAVRNQPKAGDAGGFSFRLDMDSDGNQVIKKSAIVRDASSGEQALFMADIYPNPSSGRFLIAVENADNFNVSIFDVNGQMITEIKDQNLEAEVDITSFPQGLYFFKVMAGNQTYLGKVLKN